MEENLNNENQLNNKEPNLKKEPRTGSNKKRKKVKIAIITLSTLACLLGGLQVYASVNGYGNVFFMIKNLVTTGNPAGNQEIFSDKDITLSYKSIELTDSIKIQVNRLEIKDGKTKIYTTIKSTSNEKVSLKYVVSVKDQKDTEIIGTVPKDNPIQEYQDLLELNYEVKDTDIIKIVIKNNENEELRTLEINLQTREIIVTGEAELKKISQIELTKYLSVFSHLKNDATKQDSLLYIAKEMENNHDNFMSEENYNNAKKSLTDRAFKNAIIKEIYGDKAEFEYKAQNNNKPDVEVLKGIKNWKYDSDRDLYEELAYGQDYLYAKCLKIEDVNYKDGVYTIKYVYLLATINEMDEGILEDLPQYETTIKLQRKENNLYSKYQIIDIEEEKVIDNKVSTVIEENNIFNNLEKIVYDANLTDSKNGKIAILKLGENEFKTTQHDGYYTYTDMFNNSYNIKKIINIISSFSTLSSDNRSALFCCTIYYIDNNNEEKNFDVAVIVTFDDLGNTSEGIMGTYINYTGTTAFTKFVGLYEEPIEQLDDNLNHSENNTTSQSNNNETDLGKLKDEVMNVNNWKYIWPEVGMKVKLPENFELGNTWRSGNHMYAEAKGWIISERFNYITQQAEGYEKVPVRVVFGTELRIEYNDIWDLLRKDADRNVESKDNKGWTYWYPLNDYNIPYVGQYIPIRRAYGRIRDDMIEKTAFDIQTSSGINLTVYQFMNNVLSSAVSTSV